MNLFIYIPTYNRPNALIRQLASIEAQRADWPGKLRVLVSDNASPLISDDDLASYAKRFDVEVRRNPANLGGNANIALGFLFADLDEHLWVLGDDDELDPRALSYIAQFGSGGQADAIVLTPGVDEVTDVVHEWKHAWAGVKGSGLIGNMIYRASVFVPQASHAFLYHNTGFPHLGVLLATLRRHGRLNYRSLPNQAVYSAFHCFGAEEPGDYSLSYLGMPQLMPLLPKAQARRFAWKWVKEQGRGFFRHRQSYPGLYVGTLAHLRRYGGIRALVWLAVLRVEHALFGRIRPHLITLAHRILPDRFKRFLRSQVRESID
ncbi:MAG: glycosyltransferase family 2 protein [Actinobacteria bacterium]|nr:glycosyltransferase family 2 protein [Actinomycetota bacterium]